LIYLTRLHAIYVIFVVLDHASCHHVIVRGKLFNYSARKAGARKAVSLIVKIANAGGAHMILAASTVGIVLSE
jgi:hypothetical protein